MTRACLCLIVSRTSNPPVNRAVPPLRSVRLRPVLFGFSCPSVQWVSIRFGGERCNLSHCVSGILLSFRPPNSKLGREVTTTWDASSIPSQLP